jgi:hypothetical protein
MVIKDGDEGGREEEKEGRKRKCGEGVRRGREGEVNGKKSKGWEDGVRRW